MWKKGTVKISIPKPTIWCVCGNKKEWHPTDRCDNFQANTECPWMHDEDTLLGESATNDPIVYLPHSCDEWVIGSKEDVEGLIADLQTSLQLWPE